MKRPTTTFTGHSNPRTDRVAGASVWWAVTAAAVVISPIGAAVAFTIYLTFQWARVSYKVFAAITAAYAVILAGWVVLLDRRPGYTYLTGPRELAAAVSAGSTDRVGDIAAERWPTWLVSQIPLSILLGLLVGTGLCMWRWIRRPVWEDYELRPTPWEKRRYRRVVAAIRADQDTPTDGITVGVQSKGDKVVQTDHEAARHTLLTGGVGSGKTTTAMIGLRDVIKRGMGVVVIDAKGGRDVPEILASYCQRYGRPFQHFLLFNARSTEPYDGPAADGPAYYDPVGRGDPTRRKDLLVGSHEWDAAYYKNEVENYLQLAFIADDLFLADSPQPTLERTSWLLIPENLRSLADRDDPRWTSTYRGPEFRQSIHNVTVNMSDREQSAIRSMYNRMQILRASVAGDFLRADPFGDNTIDLYGTAARGGVVVFSLDSANYQELTKLVGTLIIQDLKTVSGELRRSPVPQPMHVFVDEFAALGNDNIIGLLNKCRDAGMPVTVSTQTLPDLARVDPNFLGQVLGVVNCFKIMGTNAEADALVFAGLTGKHRVLKKKYQFEMDTGMPGGIGVGAATGGGTVEEAEDYIVPASAIQRLTTGQLVYVAKSPDQRVIYPVQVIRDDPEPVRGRYLARLADQPPHPGAPSFNGTRGQVTSEPTAAPTAPVGPPLVPLPAPTGTPRTQPPAPVAAPLPDRPRHDPVTVPDVTPHVDVPTGPAYPGWDGGGWPNAAPATPPTNPRQTRPAPPAPRTPAVRRLPTAPPPAATRPAPPRRLPPQPEPTHRPATPNGVLPPAPQPRPTSPPPPSEDIPDVGDTW